MFNYMSKIVPWSARINKSNFEKIAYGDSYKKAEVSRFVLKKPN